MKMKAVASITPAFMILLLAILACNLGTPRPPNQAAPTALQPTIAEAASPSPSPADEIATEMGVPPTVAVTHINRPADLAVTGQLVYDVESVDTAPEKRAPYGDSYNINRLERPFLQDMTYVPSLDISTYMVGKDMTWFYVSIALVGADPNDKLGINYAVELDTNYDGFGDYVIWAQPPYPAAWDTAPVQILRDTNHNTSGISADKSDAPFSADGYDSIVFNGGNGDADPDIAWVRANSGVQGFVQFAFKRSWSGEIFMLGALADAGLKDPKKLDYVDRFAYVDAGSPVRDNQYYPLKALFAIDNVCREAFGFKPTGYEPQLCPREAPPATKKPRSPAPPPPSGCQPPPTGCPYGWAGEPFCYCIPG